MCTAIRNARPITALGTLTLLLAGATSHADVEVTAAIATDYLHRGLNQTLSGPAYQAAAEYHADGGWFAGAWASRVDFEPFDDRYAEVDYYAGYGRRLNRHVALEAAFIRYDYQGSGARDYDWQELQFTAYVADHWAITWGVADDWWAANERSHVLEATVRYPLPGRMTLDATLGRQFTREAIGVDYSYGQLGLSLPVGEHVVLRVAYAGTDDDIRRTLRPMTGQRWLGSLTWQP